MWLSNMRTWLTLASENPTTAENAHARAIAIRRTFCIQMQTWEANSRIGSPIPAGR
jgi:hypothetical protein